MISAHGFTPGEILAGKYKVERVLGVGGMGVVIAAQHVELDEKVALKFLLPDALQDEDAVARFGREARAAVKIKSEHVARVADVGQIPGRGPYMVMEYLEGIDLSVWLKQRGPMPAERAVGFILQACEALAEAHGLGIVHRDLKPGNLFCIQRADGQPSVKVLDFGISKIVTGGAPHDMTRTNTMFGSPAYMSPEQVRSSRGVDTRTDLWSLGIILYELTVGRPPFRATTITELAVIITNEPFPSLASLPGIPAGLEAVIARCLEKDRAKRFQDVGELALALEPFGTAPRAHASVERILGTLRQSGVRTDGAPPSAEHSASLPSESPASAAPAAALLSTTSLERGPSAQRTAAEWGRTNGSSAPKVNRSARTAALVALSATVMVLLACGVLLFRRPTPLSSPLSNPPARAADAAEYSSSALPTPSEPALPAQLPPKAVQIPSAAPGPEPVPSASTPRKPTRAPVRPDCNPPWTRNAKGARVYKEECL